MLCFLLNLFAWIKPVNPFGLLFASQFLYSVSHKILPIIFKVAHSPPPLSFTILVKNSSLVSKKMSITSFSTSSLVPSSSFYIDPLKLIIDQLYMQMVKYVCGSQLSGSSLFVLLERVSALASAWTRLLRSRHFIIPDSWANKQNDAVDHPSSLSWSDEPPGYSRLSFYTQSARQAICSFSFSLPARPLPSFLCLILPPLHHSGQV